ncbi:MAG TPA: winged helix-turn-helix domain-containing protein [Thermoanaerobaculia bacterium]|nr:winged helix-turn-helix domain-containing protein [Thermoanaerobaculia bacterium]
MAEWREFRLGDFRIRPQTRELIGPAGTIRLKPRSMDVLLDLAEHAGQLRTREEVLASVWGDIAVGEEVLTHCIWELRQALGDDRREPRFIETLHRSGYRLIAPVVPSGQVPRESAVEPRGRAEDDRELGLLLGRVQRFWIEQVLERSLGGNESLVIAADERPDLLRHPWAGAEHSFSLASEHPSLRTAIPRSENIFSTFGRMGSALLIVGAIGAGKTVTLLQLAQQALDRARNDPAAPIPVVLPLASWNEHPLPLERWISSEIRVRYFLPRQMAAAWLERGRLLLFLDGLDEVGAARRSDCIEAINRFRRAMPLTALAVTCREEDYAASAGAGHKLELDGAIGLQPLASSQVAAALARNARLDGEDLEHVVTTPLLLGLAQRVLADEREPVESASEHEADGMQDRLFRRLVRDSLRSKEDRRGYREAEAIRWLSRLARTMVTRNRTVLAVEELQPSWLVSARDRVGYVLLTRFLAGIWIGVGAACFLGVLARSATLAIGVACDGAAAGLAIALLDAFLLGRPRSNGLASANRLASSFAYAALAGSAAAAAVLIVHLARGHGVLPTAALFHGLLFALILARPLGAVRFDRDVGAVEALTWSWSAALRGWLGAGALTWSLLALGRLPGWAHAGEGASALSTLPNSFLFALAPAMLLGLEAGAIEGKTRPNHGIWLSARNAVLSGWLVLAGCFVSVVAGWLLARNGWIGTVYILRNVRMQPGLQLLAAVGGCFAPLAALRFGGLDVVKHGVLRLLLWHQGLCPLLFPRFLEHATRRGLLRRAGDGYLFFHSTLMAYFASMEESGG